MTKAETVASRIYSATKAALAPVVLALHDPCIPVQLHLPQTETARA